MSEQRSGPLPIPQVSTTGWAIWVRNTGKHERQWAAFARRMQAAQYVDTCPDFRQHTCKAVFLEPYEPGAPVGQPWGRGEDYPSRPKGSGKYQPYR
jgi:hypothetical protein